MGRPVYLVWAGEDLVAFHRKDPHPRGCLVGWAAAERRFVEPCLGSTYGQDGRYLAGPSPRDLDRFPIRRRNGQFEINVDHLTPGIVRNPPIPPGSDFWRGWQR